MDLGLSVQTQRDRECAADCLGPNLLLGHWRLPQREGQVALAMVLGFGCFLTLSVSLSDVDH